MNNIYLQFFEYLLYQELLKLYDDNYNYDSAVLTITMLQL